MISERPGWVANSLIAYHGFTAASTPGAWAISIAPSTASVANHRIITGPNNRPTRSVPRRWIANNATITPSVTGNTALWNCGSRISRPSTALNTEIAGVINASQ